MHAVPIVLSAAVQTTVRHAPLKLALPVTAIAMAGRQNKAKASLGREKMSRDWLVLLARSMRLHQTPSYTLESRSESSATAGDWRIRKVNPGGSVMRVAEPLPVVKDHP